MAQMASLGMPKTPCFALHLSGNAKRQAELTPDKLGIAHGTHDLAMTGIAIFHRTKNAADRDVVAKQQFLYFLF